MTGSSGSPASASPADQLATSPSKKQNPEPARVRSSRACTHCSHRKAKCDGLLPCSSCARGQHECFYTTPKKRGPPKGAPARGGVKKKRPAPQTGAAASEAPLQTQTADPTAADAKQDAKGLGAAEANGQAYQKPMLSHPCHSEEAVYVPRLPSDGDRLPTVDFVLSSISGETSSARLYRPEAGLGSTTESEGVRNRLQDSPGWDGSAREPSYHRPWKHETTTAPEAVLQRRPSNETQGSMPPYSNWRRPVMAPSRVYGQAERPRDYGLPSTSFSRPAAANVQLASGDFSSHIQYSHQPQRPQHSDGLGPSTLQNGTGPQTLSRYNLSANSLGGVLGGGLMASASVPTPPGLARGASPHPAWPAVAQRGPYFLRTVASFTHTTAAQPASTSFNYHRQLPSSAAATIYERNSATDAVYHGKRESLYASSSDRTHDESPGTSFWSSTSASGMPNPTFSTPPHTSGDPSDDGARIRLGLRGSRPIQKAEDSLPSTIVQRLISIYEAFIHPHWPIIYLPSITSLQSLRTDKPILFEAILAVASATFDTNVDTSERGSAPSSQLDLFFGCRPDTVAVKEAWTSGELCRHFVDRVKERILNGRFERDTATVQAAILISVVEMGSGNNSSAWHFSGIAVRTVLDMNLHRLSNRTQTSAAGAGAGGSGASNAVLQEQKRVLWAAHILDKILSVVLEKPVQLRSIDIETDMPSIYERDEYDLWLNDTTRLFVPPGWLHVMEGVKVHAMSSFHSWAQLMGILEHILDDIYSPRARSERRRSQGDSDRAVQVRLNAALQMWRQALPAHLQWTDPPPSAERFTSSGMDQPGTRAHRGVGPHVLTVRGWYCICVILLHRPRVPQLLKLGRSGRDAKTSRVPNADPGLNVDPANRSGPPNSSARSGSTSNDFTSVPLQPQMQDIVSPSSPSFHGELPPTDGDTGSGGPAHPLHNSTPPGLEICSLAAKKVCDILQVYGTTFRIRKIPSSWVYLIFQSATIHSALAPIHAARAHRRHQSRLAKRLREGGQNSSRFGFDQSLQSTTRGWSSEEEPDDDDEDDEMLQVGSVWAVTSGQLASMKESEMYLGQCLKFLDRIGPTWKIASHHVTTLQKLCIASAKTRPSSPIRISKAEEEESAATEEPHVETARAQKAFADARNEVRAHVGLSTDTGDAASRGEAQQRTRSTNGALDDLAHEAVRFRDSAQLSSSAVPFDNLQGGPSSVLMADSTSSGANLSSSQTAPALQSSTGPSAATIPLQVDPTAWNSYCDFWNEMPLTSEYPAIWDSFFVRDVDASVSQPDAQWMEQGDAAAGISGAPLHAIPRGGGLGLASTDPRLTAFFGGET